MAEIDTSTYPKLQSAGPLEIASQANQLQAQQMQNYGAAQQLKARSAMGPILQHSIGPDGQLDYNKAFQLMSQNPDTAWTAADFLNQAIQRKQVQAETALKEFGLNKDKYEMAAKVASQALVEGKAGDRDYLTQHLANANKQGLISDKDYYQIVAGLPQTAGLAPGSSDPALEKAVKGLGMRAATISETMQAVVPKLATLDTGGTKTLVNEPTLANPAPSVVGTVANTPTVAERNAPVTTVNPLKGTERAQPRQDALPIYNGDGTLANGPSSAGAATPQAGVPGQEPPPSSVPAAPPKSVVTKLGPAAEAQMKDFPVLGEEISKAYQQSNDVMRLVSGIEDAAKNFKQGPGQENMNELAGLFASLGAPKDVVDKIQGGSFANAQVFKSDALQLATALMKQALEGGGKFTNLEFSSFLNTKPGLSTDPQATKKIFALLKANNMALESMQKKYNDYQNDPNTQLSRSAFMSEWAPHATKINNWLKNGGLDKLAEE